MHLETEGVTWVSAPYPTVGCGGVGYLQRALEKAQWLSGASPCEMAICDHLPSASATVCNLTFPPRKSRRRVQDSSHSPASYFAFHCALPV